MKPTSYNLLRRSGNPVKGTGRWVHSRPSSRPHPVAFVTKSNGFELDVTDVTAIDRRSMAFAILLAPLAISAGAGAETGMGRYIKRKALDPLETYVPVVLVARRQLEESGEVMTTDQKTARSFLREGAFSGLRESIRALGEYAVTNGKENQKSAAAIVAGFFGSLDNYDRILFNAVKNTEDKMDMEAATQKLKATTDALDKLLGTVPDDIMAKSKAILVDTQMKSAAATETTPSDDEKILKSLMK